MEIALLLVALAVTVLAVTAIAGKLDISAPLLLIGVGITLSFVPGVPEVHLHEEVVLLGFLPPLLYAAALQTSLIDFNVNRRGILLLSVGLVIFTTFGVGAVVHFVVPEISWAASFAIGAVVAPPDAVAATAIAKRIGLPRSIVTLLEGESLLNDATALVALRTAIAATSGTIALGEIGIDFAIAAGGGVLVGLLGFLVVAKMRRFLTDPMLDTAISIVTPFAAYIAAEEIHASGVIAVVVAGLLLGHKAPLLQTAQSRISERNNWRMISFILENTVFLLIGLQAHWILQEVGESEIPISQIVLLCAAALLAVILLRLVWLFPVRFILNPRSYRRREVPASYAFLIGWAGMRGVVTLAAAFLIPEEVEHREVLLLVAFTVVAGTLFIQGLSLPWLARRMNVPGPDRAEDALARATLLHQAGQAGLKVMDEPGEDGLPKLHEDPHGVREQIRQRVERREFAAWELLGNPSGDTETPTETYARVRSEMIQAERGKVLEVRSSGTVPQEVVSEVLAMLDVEESMLEGLGRELDHDDSEQVTRSARVSGSACEDLPPDLVAAEPLTPGVCAECAAEGASWVHLRRCVECGNVGCCDSSAGRHASTHFHDTGHRVMQSGEPGESWRWCFVHNQSG